MLKKEDGYYIKDRCKNYVFILKSSRMFSMISILNNYTTQLNR